ncbi:MAG: hemerythrin domain-containing protein [Deltaproteobacteria bacterium]|nr:hemerythrin domain-containing protein [Deltaproteobacteria bacterium]
MAISIGRRKDPGDLVDTLLDCHERIRRFSGIAQRLADAQGAAEADIAEAAESVRRYFREGLPHHVADEEESILPRLRGKDPDADRALETMEREHRSHEPRLARLVELCTTLATTPSRHPELAADLRTLSTELAEELERHLALEEEVTFPAIRRHLSEDQQRTIAEEMSRRRRPQPVS